MKDDVLGLKLRAIPRPTPIICTQNLAHLKWLMHLLAKKKEKKWESV